MTEYSKLPTDQKMELWRVDNNMDTQEIVKKDKAMDHKSTWEQTHGIEKTPSPIDMLVDNNNQLRNAGCKLAEAALRVATEYDGVHRLMIAVSAWTMALANESGRGNRYKMEEQENDMRQQDWERDNTTPAKEKADDPPRQPLNANCATCSIWIEKVEACRNCTDGSQWR